MVTLTNLRRKFEASSPTWAIYFVKRAIIKYLVIRGIQSQKGRIKHNPTLPTIIIVSHEASETGAPILASNIGKKLSEKANIITILLKEGKLLEQFKKHSVALLQPKEEQIFARLLSSEINKITKGIKPQLAIINSVVSAGSIQPLRSLGIPTITLFHEFSSYIRPASIVNTIGLWSSCLVFSSYLTRDDILNAFPQLKGTKTIVLPQGKCEAVSSAIQSKSKLKNENISQLSHRVHKGDVLILGAGVIQPRKGIDIFISVAIQLSKYYPIKNIKFVWMGSGYEPETDYSVSIWIKDQIERANLRENVFIIDHSPEYEKVMARADLFLVTSRLDPLPNVAIDALTSKIPVMCFEKACGLTELYKENRLLYSTLVSPYLDADSMARKLGVLLSNSNLRQNMSVLCGSKAREWFDFDKYVENLLRQGDEACREEAILESNIQLLSNLNIVNLEYSVPNGSNKSNSLAHYLRTWQTGVGVRKPFPGFHPGIYRHYHQTTKNYKDALIDYIDNGKPEGPWINNVITPNKENLYTNPSPIGLHIHVYYEELLEEILTGIASNKIKPEIYISYSKEEHWKSINDILDKYKMNVKDIILTPNCGRDIGPLLTEIGPRMEKKYCIYGHIHTKKSIFLGSKTSNQWRKLLLANLLGTKEHPMMDKIVSILYQEKDTGLVFPDDPHCAGWDKNLHVARVLARRMQIDNLPEQFCFPIGTMFWAKNGALEDLYNLKLSWSDYPEEPIEYDGTMLHAIERLIPIVAKNKGFSYRLTHVPGVYR